MIGRGGKRVGKSVVIDVQGNAVLDLSAGL